MNTIALTKDRDTDGHPLPLWWIKLTRFEFWPVWAVYFPAFFYWLYLSLKARSFGYVSAANPAIENGGVFGESKSKILDLVPAAYKPRSITAQQQQPLEAIMENIRVAEMEFPVICKPDKGERGFRVEKVYTTTELEAYAAAAADTFIIQECITWPLEFGVLYFRMPDGTSGITSVTGKHFLTVTGDGISDVEALLDRFPRGRMQVKRLKVTQPLRMSMIPASGEEWLIEPIGNHCLGTTFLNRNDLISQEMVMFFDALTAGMEGFHYGRFDLKVQQESDLYTGQNLRVLELNGSTSEPGHIYDPQMTLTAAWSSILHHMKIVNDIAIMNIQRGFTPVPFLKIIKESLQHLKNKK